MQVPDAVRGAAVMSPSLREAARAVAEAMFTRDDGPPSGASLDWLCAELDDFFRHAGARAALVFRACITAISWVAPWTVGRLVPFARLGAADRGEALARMERGPLALAVFGAKAILCILYYEHPSGARWAGYDGACLTRRSGAS